MDNKLKAIYLGLELGFLIAIPLVVFTLLGVWMDNNFQTLPLFLIIFILLGLIVTMINVKKIIVPIINKKVKDNNKNNNK